MDNPSDEWVLCKDRSGLTFYHNRALDASVWTLPPGARCEPSSPAVDACVDEIDFDWRQALDEEGDVYYWNIRTRETTWCTPLTLAPALGEHFIQIEDTPSSADDPLPELPKPISVRNRVLLEILETETSYVKSLRAVVELYVSPLTATDQGATAAAMGLTKKDCDVLFGYIYRDDFAIEW